MREKKTARPGVQAAEVANAAKTSVAVSKTVVNGTRVARASAHAAEAAPGARASIVAGDAMVDGTEVAAKAGAQVVQSSARSARFWAGAGVVLGAMGTGLDVYTAYSAHVELAEGRPHEAAAKIERMLYNTVMQIRALSGLRDSMSGRIAISRPFALESENSYLGGERMLSREGQRCGLSAWSPQAVLKDAAVPFWEFVQSPFPDAVIMKFTGWREKDGGEFSLDFRDTSLYGFYLSILAEDQPRVVLTPLSHNATQWQRTPGEDMNLYTVLGGAKYYLGIFDGRISVSKARSNRSVWHLHELSTFSTPSVVSSLIESSSASAATATVEYMSGIIRLPYVYEFYKRWSKDVAEGKPHSGALVWYACHGLFYVALVQLLLAVVVAGLLAVLYSRLGSPHKGYHASLMTILGGLSWFIVVFVWPCCVAPVAIPVFAAALSNSSRRFNFPPVWKFFGCCWCCRCGLYSDWIGWLGMGPEQRDYHKDLLKEMWWNPWALTSGMMLDWDSSCISYNCWLYWTPLCWPDTIPARVVGEPVKMADASGPS
eukprot:TRINITY_DN24013_c0_g1_i1.p1 TRINITY_DN24013_c0_g1~~TRINITY_DN24013_c0_g1_i1.p1  ORF type:complete len:543 (-),score=32.88 TRINITY_DN24013_c0_g1_i1:35-1663(-)